MPTYPIDGKAGARLLEAGGPNDDFAVGTVCQTNKGRFQRVISGTAINTGRVVHIAASGTASLLTQALSSTAGQIGVYQGTATAATGSSAWVQVSGDFDALNVLANCNSGVPLFTTDTAGSLDDATASASSHRQVFGLLLNATNSGSASNVAARSQGDLLIKQVVA